MTRLTNRVNLGEYIRSLNTENEILSRYIDRLKMQIQLEREENREIVDRLMKQINDLHDRTFIQKLKDLF